MNKINTYIITLLFIALYSFHSTAKEGYEDVISNFNEHQSNKKADKRLSAGDTTIFDDSENAYSHEIATYYKYNRQYTAFGGNIFNTKWVPYPNVHQQRNGLGPLYVSQSCSGCHYRDGRGQPPAEGELLRSMAVPISIPGKDKNGAPNPHPIYGTHLQDKAINGVKPEGKLQIKYSMIDGEYADGEKYQLRKPEYTITNLNYGDIGKETIISPRSAPAMPGLALLMQIPEETIISIAYEQSKDDTMVAGKPNYVWNSITQKKDIGRIGWKASTPTVEQQIASALLKDMGIKNMIFPDEDCTKKQKECSQAPSNQEHDIRPMHHRILNSYVRALAIPARRNVDNPAVIHGEKLFKKIGCLNCHRTNIRTSYNSEFTETDKKIERIYHYTEFSNQLIHPYTDLLLHDMGEGLADGMEVFEASGNHWRTAPLWGIGLVQTVNRHNFLLHDGRARGFAEAILWHGGEAETAKENFRNMNKKDRKSLIRFLESL